MGFLKEKYCQFRRWQQQPFEYHDTGDRHVCSNCGNEYGNNYCPRCGQKAVYGPITWDSVWQGVMDVWGVGTRSLPYSLWQLMWRPGYLIRDYISGKRQVSFPPVKMLVIVFFAVYVLGKLLVPEFWGDLVEDEAFTSTKADGLVYYLDLLWNELGQHPDWAFLFMFSLMILPTWFVFRYAPRFPRHTLPQGFFIQVFMTVQFFVWVFLASLVLKCLNIMDFDEDFFALVFVIMNLVMLVDYKQLFGYSWWGTVWRMVTMAVVVILSMFFVFAPLAIYDKFYFTHEAIDWSKVVTKYIMSLAAIVGILWVVYFINRRLWRNRQWHFRQGTVIAALVVAILAGLAEYQFKAVTILARTVKTVLEILFNI